MNQNEALQDENEGVPRVVVAGVGGFGCRAVDRMAERGISGEDFAGCRNEPIGRVDFVCADTDFKELGRCTAARRLQLGERLAHGLGSNGDLGTGREAVLESFSDMRQILQGAGVVFIVCGMGGGTGAGAAPVIARAARDAGTLAVAVAAMPLTSEGPARAAIARDGIRELARHADSFVTLSGELLLSMATKKPAGRETSFQNLLRGIADVLFVFVRDIAILCTVQGYACLDLMDIVRCLAGTGRAAMTSGTGRGRDRARQAVQNALASPLMKGIAPGSAKGVVYAIFAPEDFSGEEMEIACGLVEEWASRGAGIFFNVYFDDSLEDEIRVTVIAAGAGQQEQAS